MSRQRTFSLLKGACAGVLAGIMLASGAAPPPAASPPPARRRTPPRAAGSVTATPTAPRCTLPDSAPKGRGSAGGSIALSPFEATAAVADTDNNAVVVLALEAGAARVVRRIAVGRAPAQVALGSDGRLFVTERQANAVAVFDSRDGRLLCRARVAADPVGLALAPDERTVYVTSGLSRALTALDAETLAARFELEVPREPRGLVVAPDGATLFIAHLAGQPMSAVDLGGEAPRLRPVPPVPVPVERAEHVAFSPLRLRPELLRRHPLFDPLLKRTAPGDADATPPPRADRGARIIMMPDHHANRRFFRLEPPRRARRVTPRPSQAWSVAMDPGGDEVFVPFMVNRTGRELPREERRDVYGGGSVSPGPEPEKLSFAVAAFDRRSWRWRAVALPEGNGATRRSGALAGAPRVRIPSAVVVRPSDRALLVTSMGSSALAVLGTGPRLSEHFVAETVTAPCGVVVARDGTSLVFSRFEHAVEVRGARGRSVVTVGDEPLPPEVARGRLLFHAANDPRLSSGGLSCGGCHPDGRDDGLVWFLSQGPRQTPTLAGRLVHPFNWNGTQQALGGNIVQTIRRLGGAGVKPSEVEALVAYLTHGLEAPVVPPAPPAALAARGRELFAGDAACDVCHDPERNFTDGVAHVLGGLGRDETRRAFDTPSLRYVGATAPYFHDGRYATLREVLTDPRHRMGHVERLTPPDVDALLAYLETL